MSDPIKNDVPNRMIKWMQDLWDFPRSLTGRGTLDTLNYLQGLNKELKIHSFLSGEKVFDWIIPDEWNIDDAYIEHESGERFAEFKVNNLHLVGYSIPCDFKINLKELLPHIYSLPDQPGVIPYVTSYYKDDWGFCLSHNQKKILPKGEYKVVIKSNKKSGEMHLADLYIEGRSKEEIFFTTYVCHPSMANNELSGPVLSSAIIKYVKQNYSNPQYSYRFVFAPETIGAIAYLSKNIANLKSNVIAGFNLSCVGDERAFSHIESRFGKTLADQALESALLGRDNIKKYSFLERGSDERQYCAPGIDLPFCGFSRSKYGTYPEYHTSADNFELVTENGLRQSLEVFQSIIDAFESGLYPENNFLCEPQLGRRDLFPSISKKDIYTDLLKTRLNILAYADGKLSLFEIANLIKSNLSIVVSENNILKKHGLIKSKNNK